MKTRRFEWSSMSIDLSRIALLALTLPLFAWACGGGDSAGEEELDPDDAAAEMQRTAEEMERAAQDYARGAGGSVEAVDFRRLRDLLPEAAAGFERTSAEGEQTAAMGMNMSTATATYENEEGASLNLTISDMGSLTSPMAMGIAAWASVQVDRETDTGYERTVRHDGHPAFETFDATDGPRGQATLDVIVGQRFLVEIDGYGVTMDEVKELAGEIDLGELEDLRDEGR